MRKPLEGKWVIRLKMRYPDQRKESTFVKYDIISKSSGRTRAVFIEV